MALSPANNSSKLSSSRIMCGISFEHAESAKMLLASGNFTSASGIVRLQYEALVRAVWLLYAAPDADIDKLMCELTAESAQRANNLTSLTQMFDALEGEAPAMAVNMLKEFKEYHWKPLCSFVHGGIHAINRHQKGYPVELLRNVLKASSGLSMMAGMHLVILHGGGEHSGKVRKLQLKYAHCLPEFKITNA